MDSVAHKNSDLLIQRVDWQVGKFKHAQGYEFNCKWLFFNMELGVLNILLQAGWQPYFK